MQTARGREGDPRVELLRDLRGPSGRWLPFFFCTGCWGFKSTTFWLIPGKELTVPHECFYINLISSSAPSPAPFFLSHPFSFFPVSSEVKGLLGSACRRGCSVRREAGASGSRIDKQQPWDSGLVHCTTSWDWLLPCAEAPLLPTWEFSLR